VKHPAAKTYIVCALREDPKAFSPNFRNTLAMTSKAAVEEAYDEFSVRGKELGIIERWPLEEINGSVSFCFRDPGTNCWEIAFPG
jgi:hypothetical protein